MKRKKNENGNSNKQKLELIGEIGFNALKYLADEFDIRIAEEDEDTYFQLMFEMIEAKLDELGIENFVDNNEKINHMAYHFAFCTYRASSFYDNK